ncbi:MAG: GMC family oxidoreductase [Terriglobales bacterium]
MKTPLGGPFRPPRPGDHRLGSLQHLNQPMRLYRDQDTVDYCVVGVGSAGGVLVQRLARAGFKVVGLEVGPFWDIERDWVSDEAGSHHLYWTDLRITGGTDPIALGENNSGRGVGGGSVHWAAFVPRLHPSDFRVYSEDGVGCDWPISYQDLKPYYELIEREMPAAGPAWFPWGDPHGYPFGPHPIGGVGDVLVNGCTKLGIRVCAGGPVAILSGSRADRPHCIYRGYCLQGCKVGAKQSTLISHVPDALAHGAEVRDRAMVSRILLDRDGRVSGLDYFDRDGKERRQNCRAAIVCGYAIETPRLLLNSACPAFEHGLANSSGLLGHFLMVQAGNVVSGRFPHLVRMYKAPPAHALTEEFYETDPQRGFAVQTVGPLPIAFAKQMAKAKGAWGWGMRQIMMDYNHWAALGVIGEILPWYDNQVELAQEKDDFGLPVGQVTFNLHQNDRKLIRFAVQKVEEILRAAGAEEVAAESRFAHLVGGARMGNDPAHSVVDGFGRTHDIANLFVCDGSIFPTQGSANPGLTIQALAARTADYLIHQGEAIFRPGTISREKPPLRRDLSPPATWSGGVPPHL